MKNTYKVLGIASLIAGILGTLGFFCFCVTGGFQAVDTVGLVLGVAVIAAAIVELRCFHKEEEEGE